MINNNLSITLTECVNDIQLVKIILKETTHQLNAQILYSPCSASFVPSTSAFLRRLKSCNP